MQRFVDGRLRDLALGHGRTSKRSHAQTIGVRTKLPQHPSARFHDELRIEAATQVRALSLTVRQV
jgi:hypothetical protein